MKFAYISVVAIITILLSFVFDSRTIFISSILGILTVLKINRKISLFIWGILLLAVAFVYKQDSTYGRFFVYQNSLSLYFKNPIAGVGLGRFQREYLLEQAEYFGSLKIPIDSRFFYLADDTRFAFNDYLQLICELGVLGLVTCIILIITLHALCKLPCHTLENRLAKHIFFSTLAAAMFTHVFEKPYLIAICCFSFLNMISYVPIKSRVLHMAVALIVLSTTLWETLQQNNVRNITDVGRFYVKTRQFSFAKKVFDGLMHSNSCNEYCQFEYAKIQYLHKDYKNCEIVLTNLLENHSSSLYYSLLGACKIRQHNYTEGLVYYDLAINMVPSRFETRFNLLNFHMEKGDNQNAILVARQIVQMSEKVPTKRSNYIKQYSQNLL